MTNLQSVRNLFPKWQPGRQGTGYRKMSLGRGNRWDLWLLDYPPNTGIPLHTDPLPGRRHARANFAISDGGVRAAVAEPIFEFGPLQIFYSDAPHLVPPTKKRRMILSLGLSLPMRVRDA